MLKDIVLNTIKKYNLIEDGDKIVLGVSRWTRFNFYA